MIGSTPPVGTRLGASVFPAGSDALMGVPTEEGINHPVCRELLSDLASRISTFHVVNLGCKVNRVESDTIAAALLTRGCMAVPLAEADLIVVNTCTVTGEADKKARKAVRHAISMAPSASVIVTGCAVAIDAESYARLGESVIAVGKAELLQALQLVAPSCEAGEGGLLRMGEGFRTRVSIKVQDGCDHACTYCIVHVARGRARSARIDDVLEEARSYFEAGLSELVLAGIDLGSYCDGDIRLDGLVRSLIGIADEATAIAVESGAENVQPARIRASSLEPQTVSDAFVDLLASSEGRLCRHLHLPLQSGSSKVLKEMARPYTAERFRDIVGELYRRVPELSLTTDIICGFPGETDEDFEETMQLARECRFSKIHVFPYSRREGTPAAARKDQVPAPVKAERAARLRELSGVLRAEDLRRRCGTTELALVEGATMLTESYHELPASPGAMPGTLIPVSM